MRHLRKISGLAWLLIAAALVIGGGSTAAAFTLAGGSDGGVVAADLSGGACPKNFDPLIGQNTSSSQFAQGYNRAVAGCYSTVLSPMYNSAITSAAQVTVVDECRLLSDLTGMDPYEWSDGGADYNAHAQNAAFALLNIALQLYENGCSSQKPKFVFLSGTQTELLARAGRYEREVFSNN